MIPAVKPGVTLAASNGPMIETERLILRPWRADDIAPNTAMLADPSPAASSPPTASRSPMRSTDGATRRSWPGTGCCTAFGMFVVEEKSRPVCRTRRPWFPPGWPGFEVGWGIASEFRGKGYAVEAARAAIDWSFATFEIDRIIHCIDRENIASQAVARRLGAEKGWRDRAVRTMSRMSG